MTCCFSAFFSEAWEKWCFLLFCYMKCHWGGLQGTTESCGPLTAGSAVTYSEETVSLLKAVQSGKCLQMQSWDGLHNSAEYHYFELRPQFIKLTDVDIFGKIFFFGLAVPPLPQCLTNTINYYSLENIQNTRITMTTTKLIEIISIMSPISLYLLLLSSEEKTGLGISDRFCTTILSWI